MILSLSAVALAQEGGGGASGRTTTDPFDGSHMDTTNVGSEADAHSESGHDGGNESDTISIELANWILISLAGVVFFLSVYHLFVSVNRYIRTLVSMNNPKQRYFQTLNPYVAALKKHLVYSPLLTARHKREFRPVSWLNLGIIPSRFQTLLITAFVGMNVALMAVKMPHDGPQGQMLKTLESRSGTLAVVNLIPLVILAGVSNPLISLLGIPYDSFNMMHRWLGRVVAGESIIHTVAWLLDSYERERWSGIQESLTSRPFITAGLISTVAAVAILLQSPSPIRHAFYEIFLHLHIALVILFLIFLYRHLSDYDQKVYLQIAICLWAAERLIRLASTLRTSLSLRTRTVSTLEVLPGDAVRVTIHLPRPISFHPGQPVYITIPRLGLWTAHPFSIAWSSTTAAPLLDTLEKPLPISSPLGNPHLSKTSTNASSYSLPLPPDPSSTHQTISLIVRARTGFTLRLHSYALSNPMSSPLTTLIHAPPYPSPMPSLNSYGSLLLISAGVGITSHLPLLPALLSQHSAQTTSVRSITLVWILQSPEHLEWIRPFMTEILAHPSRRETLKILLFVTKPRSMSEIRSPSQSVRMYPGRPNVRTLVEERVREQVGVLGVGVCGTGGLEDEVRKAVRKVGLVERPDHGGVANVEFLEHNYTW